MKNVGQWSEVNSNDYSPIEQGVIIINSDISNTEHAKKFLSFIMSEKGKKILLEFGYTTNLRL